MIEVRELLLDRSRMQRWWCRVVKRKEGSRPRTGDA